MTILLIYLKQVKIFLQLLLTTFIKKKENLVISMSLYGSDPRYTNGALQNAHLFKDIYPQWKLRIYAPKMESLKQHSNLKVPVDIINQLKSLDVDIIFMDVQKTKIKPMMWRFLVAEDIIVDRFIVPDIDSHLIKRDALEVEKWIQPGKAFHCIQDHPGHINWPVSGGLWGGVPSKMLIILQNTTFSK